MVRFQQLFYWYPENIVEFVFTALLEEYTLVFRFSFSVTNGYKNETDFISSFRLLAISVSNFARRILIGGLENGKKIITDIFRWDNVENIG